MHSLVFRMVSLKTMMISIVISVPCDLLSLLLRTGRSSKWAILVRTISCRFADLNL